MIGIVSGTSAVAVLIENEDFFSLTLDDAHPVPIRPADYHWLMGNARDLQFFENVTPDRVKISLEEAIQQQTAIHLALMLLDGQVPEDIREEGAGELEEFLTRREVEDFVKNIMYAHPLPPVADVKGALACASKIGVWRVKSFQVIVRAFLRLMILPIEALFVFIIDPIFTFYLDRSAHSAKKEGSNVSKKMP